MEEPTHNVLFGSVLRDRILLQGRRRGMQFPCWVEVYSTRECFPEISPDHHAGPQNRYLNFGKLVRSPSVEMAPKRAFTVRAWAVAKTLNPKPLSSMEADSPNIRPLGSSLGFSPKLKSQVPYSKPHKVGNRVKAK